MKSLMMAFAIALTLAVFSGKGAAADDLDPAMCGEAPKVEDVTLKGELKGKADFLSSFIGQAELSGQIEAAKKDVFSKSPEMMKSRAVAYLQYQVCLILIADKQLTASQKIDELLRVQKAFAEPQQ